MNKRTLFIWSLFVFFTNLPCISQLSIHEVCFDNHSNLSDENGQYYDWIELYNSGIDNIELNNYFLNDEANFGSAWQLPPLNLPAGQFLLVYASGESDKSTYLHAPFKLNNTGENLVLFDSAGHILDVSPDVEIPSNTSIGTLPLDTSIWFLFENSTPGYENPMYNPVAAPLWWEELEHTVPSGNYGFPLTIGVDSSDPTLEIRYTTNGDEPSSTSKLVVNEITLNGNETSEHSILFIPTSDTWEVPIGEFGQGTILKTAAFHNGIRRSGISQQTYFNTQNDNHSPTFLILSLEISEDQLFSDEHGIYVFGNHPYGNYHQSGEDWKRYGQLSIFDHNSLQWFGKTGIKIHGRSSRAYPQKSIRFYSDDDNVTSAYSLFEGEPNATKFLLKAPDRLFSQALFVDEFVQRLSEPLNIDLMRSRPAILYINGFYWGIHQVRDRIDHEWLRQKHEIPDDIEIDILDFDRELRVQGGNTESWNQLLSWIATHPSEDDKNIEKFGEYVDISSFKDYMTVNLFFSNLDFPVNNVRLWKARTIESKWRFILFDCDACAKDVNYSEGEILMRESTGNDPVSIVFNYLMKNNSFRQEFFIHALNLSNIHWRPDQMVDLIEEFMHILEPEIESQIRRWHYPESINAWHTSVNHLKDFAMQRHIKFQTQIGNSISTPFQLFPNPAGDHFYIQLVSGDHFEPGTVMIRDLRGKVISKLDTSGMNKTWTIDSTDLPSGMYLVDLKYGEMTFSHRMVKN